MSSRKPIEIIRSSNDLDLFEKLENLSQLLEKIEKKMNDYLETKRSKFARFYFISNEELVEILSFSRQPELIERHLMKLFDNVKILRLTTKKTLNISAVVSGEDEHLNLTSNISIEGNVEDWLKLLEIQIQFSVRESLKNSLTALRMVTNKREKWIKDWSSQSCLTASLIEWTSNTSKALLNCQIDGNLKPLKKFFRTEA